jgi:hypothetical protein
MQGSEGVAIGKPNVIEAAAHCLAYIFRPSSNYSFI